MLGPEQLDELEEFEEALYREGAVRNLTRVPREDCWVRHFLDSLLIHPLVEEGVEALDIGCGPGFPCVPLAIARPDTSWVGLDSSGKMIGFLSCHKPANLKTVCGRAESWAVRDRFRLVTGRALAPLGIQLELSAPACRKGGIVVPMRTAGDREAIRAFPAEELGLELEEVREAVLPPDGAPRVFPVFRKVAPTPRRYPRSWAEIRRRPIGS